jgi:hypothetical protein
VLAKPRRSNSAIASGSSTTFRLTNEIPYRVRNSSTLPQKIQPVCVKTVTDLAIAGLPSGCASIVIVPKTRGDAHGAGS